MRLVTFLNEAGEEKVGILNMQGTGVIPYDEYKTMQELIEIAGGNRGALWQESLANNPVIPMEKITLLAPIMHPKQDIICLGINYMAHAEESARYKGEDFGGERPFAIYFSKRVNEAVATEGAILAHEDLVDSLDYEAELAVIIGKDAKDVPKEEVRNYIFGYTILNDVSARNVQTRHKQWYFGKSLDGFTPMGPCITTVDELPYPPEVTVRSYINGELRQDGNTRDLIFDIDHIVSELSQGMTLKAGTIIATGTPAGAGMGFVPPRFLQKGDKVECVIEGIGVLRNYIE